MAHQPLHLNSLHLVGRPDVDEEPAGGGPAVGERVAAAGAGRIDLLVARSALSALRSDPDPSVVFGQLAQLCVPGVCDEFQAVIVAGDLSGPAVAPARAGRPRAGGADLDPAKFSVTVQISGGSNLDTAELHPAAGFVAALTCSWWLHQPTAEDVAVIEMVGRGAAAVVLHARQAAALQEERIRAENLTVALNSNRVISAAVGIVMAQHKLTYEQAFATLAATSQHTNRKLATLAADVLDTGDLPT